MIPPVHAAQPPGCVHWAVRAAVPPGRGTFGSIAHPVTTSPTTRAGRRRPRLIAMREIIRVAYSISLRAIFARAAPIAVLTSFSSSGGGSTAGIPSDAIQSSRVHPVV